MNEVIPGLWIGDLPSAMNVQKLKSNNIYSILSAMRGRITVNETFIRHQILIDDTEDADILSHLLPSIHFIQAELGKGRGVLVHCQAGVSRSATVVAAYLMYSKDMDPEGALKVIRQARPFVDPNVNFLQQLEIFHKSNYRISKQEKDIRRYYLERTVDEVMNGDGIPKLDMLASYPRTPGSESNPSTPTPAPRRRIRCKMCRQELATREHMLDHGQLGPETPASMTPAASRRPSEIQQSKLSLSQASNTPPPAQRRPSRPRLSFGLTDSLTMSTLGGGAKPITEKVTSVSESQLQLSARLQDFRSVSKKLMNSALTMSSAVADDDDDGDGDDVEAMNPPQHIHAEAARLLGRRLSDALMTPLSNPSRGGGAPSGQSLDIPPAPDVVVENSNNELVTTHLISPANLAAQLYANPKLAALRSPSFGSSTPPISQTITQPRLLATSPPIIMNPKCSGYFVEPMNWMEPFLQQGQLAGKITCPNKKCGTKLGNYDWAGVCCGCKEWVVPGFCISRSKVDEIVI
ncbi:hypothetical protein AGABI1DRAFT_131026 [Agaricus bisporus var. burnettii JB137-S8]|uniref:protein-tyrosine-phosphatase n=1 Tax=Agaricus bisporus var. burnettii (strain JB137-S8 / ATCC MYA-4627 / FGSC 10392) TaxID=597362 RepID=K5X1F5_AGABU|nr:uncharacterized protein AGABI1DRAFT_131026 [Agaricus bisporus var. burnettii JB137-S8]EKM76732.1 hypothetical protein AGABI1DRAFT_131026 [Agaricus bisporus var. burnettii JB137-S8]